MTATLGAPTGYLYEGKPLDAMPGKVIVEMPAVPEKIGGLYVPQAEYLRASVGRVVSGGFPRFGRLVAVTPDDGLHFTDPSLTPNELRSYGHWWSGDGAAHRVEWWHSVLFDMETQQAYGENVLIRPDAVEQGPILMLDSHKPKAMRGEVISAGPLAEDLRAGERVMYDPSRLTPWPNDEGLVVMNVTAVLARV